MSTNHTINPPTKTSLQSTEHFYNKQTSQIPLSIEKEEVFKKKYCLKESVAVGSFGEIYKLLDHEEHRIYACKVETHSKSSKKRALFKEALILKELTENEGFPRFKDFIEKPSEDMLIMSYLGPNLKSLHDFCQNKFSLKTILMISIQSVKRLEVLHSKGFLHRDIKPENFVIGSTNYTSNMIYLIDFGLSSSYLNDEKKHISFDVNNRIVGTVYFLSVYGHLGIEATRRDDLISLGYMLIHLFKGKLPWIDVKGSFEQKYIEIYKMKAKFDLKKLCQNLPDKFVDYFKYVLGLGFFEKPDYNYIVGLFQKMMVEKGFLSDGVFDWDSKFSGVCGINLNGRKISGESPTSYMKKIFYSESLDL